MTDQHGDFVWNEPLSSSGNIVGNGGAESKCTWCKDRRGFSWQIVPRALMAGMADPALAPAPLPPSG